MCSSAVPGFGFSDLENKVSCHPNTVMKIASLSKPITMAIVAKSVQQGQLTWDDRVAKHVAYWPQKHWNEEKVVVIYLLYIGFLSL